ncbi:MAG TPA: DUF2244 domain-containing protein [Burkholderiaceae bacterium]|nr:DUF2244 domain-containing protein [Burkholderiaceae bacterium]
MTYSPDSDVQPRPRMPGPAYVWRLSRTPALTPLQLAVWFGAVAAVSVVIAIGFASIGLWAMLPFAGIETAALIAAFVVYARHASDGERIELADDALRIETTRGQRTTTIELPAYWARVETHRGSRCEVRVRVGRRSVEIGRWVGEERRVQVARELATALRDIAAASSSKLGSDSFAVAGIEVSTGAIRQ